MADVKTKEREETCQTEARHKFTLKGSLLIVTDIIESELEDCEEIFTLSSTGGQWQVNEFKNPKDHSVQIDDLICLEFKGLCPKAKYTLKTKSGKDKEITIFDKVHYSELTKLSEDIDSVATNPR